MGLTKKVIMIGLDGAIYDFVEKFSSEGKLPNLTKLVKNGAFGRLLPVPPCDTPTNWTSLSTGAWTGTHGITGFNVHLPGEPLDKVHSSCDSRLCMAEHIWDVAERLGKKSIILNWPVSWPPTIKKGVVIAGTGPADPLWRLDYASTYATDALKGENKVNFVKAGNWKNTPKSHSPLLEATIPIITADKIVRWTESGLEVEEVPSKERGRKSPIYKVLVVDSKGKGYNTVIISKERDASKSIAVLKPGEWSDWINEAFSIRVPLVYHGAEVTLTKATKTEPEYRGVFRFKLVEFSPNAKKFTLYRTDIFTAKGWAYPEEVAKELEQNVGLYTDSLEIVPRIAIERDLWQIWHEQVRFQADWFVRAAEFLTKRYDWDLLFLQIHVQDTINHELLYKIFEGSPTYNKKEADEGWKDFEKSYKNVDEMIGKIVEKCADNETLIVVVSDHGALPALKRAWPGVALIREGLLAYKEDPKTGKTVVDWSKTKAMPWLMNVWVNLKGRDPDGIVDPEDYDEVVDQAIKAIYSMRDPETGECPVALALRKEDAQILGLWGERVADIYYFFKPGYTEGDLHRHKILNLPVSEILEMKDVGETKMKYQHVHYLPTAKLGICSDSGIFVMSGPGVKKGYRMQRLVWTVDVTPTICYLLGILAPAQAEGKVIRNACEK